MRLNQANRRSAPRAYPRRGALNDPWWLRIISRAKWIDYRQPQLSASDAAQQAGFSSGGQQSFCSDGGQHEDGAGAESAPRLRKNCRRSSGKD